jgi:membrane protein implicated in regulation of membrane protease activity
VLAAVEVVLGLRESNTPNYMGIVSGVASVVVPALSDSDALLAVLPVILVSASAYVVRPVLELLVSQPDEAPIGTTCDDASR